MTISARRTAGSLLLAFAVVMVAIWHGGGAGAASPRPDPSQRYSLRGVATAKKALALTFDISWGTDMPDKVLAILVRDHVPATFFLSGPWAEHHAAYVHELVHDGMEIESHGWAHVNYSGLGFAGVTQNIARANAVLTRLTGRPIRFVRPPNGDFNQTALRAAQALGYTVVTWGTDSLDWMNPGVGVIESRVIHRAHPGDIVLLHASDTCKETDLALPTIIRRLRTEGYQLVTLESLLQLGRAEYVG